MSNISTVQKAVVGILGRELCLFKSALQPFDSGGGINKSRPAKTKNAEGVPEAKNGGTSLPEFKRASPHPTKDNEGFPKETRVDRKAYPHKTHKQAKGHPSHT